MNDIILYHGSRGGIDGPIEPKSRTRCDFGSGFYMGDTEIQPAGLIVEDPVPVLYTVQLELSKFDEDRILRLDGKKWLHTILACRKRSEEFNKLELAKQALQRLNKYDIIIGPIADDRMAEAIHRFENNSLTDKGLMACLQYINYGQQYVCKTEAACKAVKIISERSLEPEELEKIRAYSAENRNKSRNIVNEMQVKYQREGLYLNELVKRQKSKEREDYDR